PPPNPMIFSPALKDRTREPVAAISPEKSDPIIDARGLNKPVKNLMKNGLPESTWQSLLFTVVARTLISTSLSFGVGMSSSFMHKSPGRPYFVCTAAFIFNRVYYENFSYEIIQS